jgi:hypothetical protein
MPPTVLQPMDPWTHGPRDVQGREQLAAGRLDRGVRLVEGRVQRLGDLRHRRPGVRAPHPAPKQGFPHVAPDEQRRGHHLARQAVGADEARGALA